MLTENNLYNYQSQHRLKKADEFSSVFIFRRVLHGNYLKIHYRPNQLRNSRLGLIVSRKNHKRANKRNYMKRVLRELFRHDKILWDNYDIVIRVQKCFYPENYQEVKAEFSEITRKLKKK